MVSEHVVLGRGADAGGHMANPRDYALPGNQDPAMPWPSSLVLLSAIASATTTLRLAAAAIIAPLRHPLLLAKDLASLDLLSEGRLVVLPTVSWHEPEYTALGVPYARRGALLDEHLEAWQAAWGPSPASFSGSHYRFEDVWVEPKPYRPDGVRLWFGSSTLHERLLRRLVRYGHGWNPLGRPAGRGRRAPPGRARRGRPGPGRVRARRGRAGAVPRRAVGRRRRRGAATIPAQLERGFTSICIKPSQFLDDPARHGAWCRDVVAKVASLTA